LGVIGKISKNKYYEKDLLRNLSKLYICAQDGPIAQLVRVDDS